MPRHHSADRRANDRPDFRLWTRYPNRHFKRLPRRGSIVLRMSVLAALNNPSDGLFSGCRPFIAPEICVSTGRRKDESAMAREWPKAEMDREIDRALARGRRRAISEPRATPARYERRTGRGVVDLPNGASFVLPARS